MFMDVIRLPQRTEDLGPRDIQRVNRLRRPLIDDAGSRQHATNRLVKRAMADGLIAAGVTGVLEWGCGYHPLRPYLPRDVTFAGVDIDPEVVAENRRHGLACFPPGEAEVPFADRPLSAVVSVFVFHFRLPSAHIATMARLLGTDAFLLANVYRRDEQSRGRLITAFRGHGLVVTREKDPAEAATGHEFWFVARPAVTQNLADKVLHTVRRSMTGG